MQRKILVVGDGPRNGRILPFTPPFAMKIEGHQVAIVGGRVYCADCDSIGFIAKAGGLRRLGYITEAAAEGDLCVCQCPQPQPLLSRLQGIRTCDDTAYPGGPVPIPLWSPGQSPSPASKAVDEQVRHLGDPEDTKAICPNMTNAAFGQLMLQLRNEAVKLVEERVVHLNRWDRDVQELILAWFGDPGLLKRSAHLSELRGYLAKGLRSAASVLRGLQPTNFVRWSPSALVHVGCGVDPYPANEGVMAQVCKPDTRTRTIAIKRGFCELRETNGVFGTNQFRLIDSKLQVLIHEVLHFEDVFGSVDHWYGMRRSMDNVNDSSLAEAKTNTDSLVGFIMGARE